METYWLCFALLSDATFGRGEGVAGLVDQEVDHDELGLPYLDGRTLKGLLNEECANIIYSLEQQKEKEEVGRWYDAADRLLGGPGSTLVDAAHLRVGPARPPADLVDAVRQAVETREASLTPVDILDSLTGIRRQTAVSAETGVPAQGTLRAMRVVLRDTPFEARLTFTGQPEPDDLSLLAACILGLRRAGTGRNRGRGRLQATLHADAGDRPGKDITLEHFNRFAREVRPCSD
jgi:hypothetical protein